MTSSPPPRSRLGARPQYADSTAIESILVVLDMLSLQLADIAKDVETSVNGVCSGFQSMGNRAKCALTAASDALDTTSEGGGLPAFVHRVRLSLDVLLQRIDSSQEHSLQLSSDIEAITHRMDVVAQLGEKVREIGEAADRLTWLNRKSDCKGCQQNNRLLEKLLEQTSVLGSGAEEAGQAISNLVTGLTTAMKNTASRARFQATEEAESTAASTMTVRNALEKMSASYQKMTQSLSGSAAMSRQLNADIGQAVMSMQFQDRVNQRIDHLLQSISELAKEIRPYTKSADSKNVQAISQFWMERLAEKSTMDAERRLTGSAKEEDSAEGSIELF